MSQMPKIQRKQRGKGLLGVEEHAGGSRESDERRAEARRLRTRLLLLSRSDHERGAEGTSLFSDIGHQPGMAAPSEPGANVVGVRPESVMLERRQLGSLERMIDDPSEEPEGYKMRQQARTKVQAWGELVG